MEGVAYIILYNTVFIKDINMEVAQLSDEKAITTLALTLSYIKMSEKHTHR